MRCHIGAEDAGAHAFVRNDGDIKKGVARPVVAVGFGINDIAELAALGDLRFQLQRIAGLVRTINHDDAIGRSHESMVTTPYLVLRKYVDVYLLHNTFHHYFAYTVSSEKGRNAHITLSLYF